MDDEEIEIDENKEQEQQQSQQSIGSQAVDTAKTVRNFRNAKNAKTAANAAQVAAKTSGISGLAGALSGVIAAIVAILLIIIIAVGLLSFIMSGLGLIWGGISEVVGGVADWWKSLVLGEQAIVSSETIQDTMNYLHSMDYDLYGYGFVTRPDEDYDMASGWYIAPNSKKSEKDEERTAQGNIKVDNDRYEELSKGSAKDNTFRYLTVYAISDNYANLIKNSNRNFAKGVESGVINPLTAAITAVNPIFGALLLESVDSTMWGTGLLSVYYEKVEGDEPVVGMRGNDVSGAESAVAGTTNTIINWLTNVTGITEDDNTDYYNAAHIKTSNGKLVVSSGAANNIKFRYNLDGWVGRYGMPLEFLLATHIATMSPDLTYRLATSFDTDVEILLRKSTNDDSSVIAGVVQKSKENLKSTNNLKTADDLRTMDEDKKEKADIVIRATDLDAALSETKGDIENDTDIFFHLSQQDVMTMFHDTELVSPESCLGTEGDKFESVYDTADGTANGYKIQITSDEGVLNSADRNKIDSSKKEDYHVLDDVTNVRQAILALTVKGLNDLVNDPRNLIKQENGLMEIDMEKYELNGANGYDDSQSGIILGDTNKNYSLLSIQNDAKYFTEVPPIQNDGGNAVIGQISGVGKYSIQDHMKDKIYNEIGSNELVELKQLSFTNTNPLQSDDEYASDYDTTPISIDFQNTYGDEFVKVWENGTSANVGVDYFIDQLLEHYNSWYDRYEFIVPDDNPWYKGVEFPWELIHETIFHENRDVKVAWTQDNSKIIVSSNDINDVIYNHRNIVSAKPIRYTNTDDESWRQVGYGGTYPFGWLEAMPSNNYMVNVATDNWRGFEERDTQYHLKKTDQRSIVDQTLKYYPIRTNVAEVTKEDTDKLFKHITIDRYKTKVTTQTAWLNGDSFRHYGSADVTNHEAKYPGRKVTGEAHKPILKTETSAWNFSFVNISEDPDENGNGGSHTFVNISISTTAPEKNGECEQAELAELGGDNYIVNYKSFDMGTVSVRVTARKISDAELERGASTSVEKRCSSMAKNGTATECCNVCYNYVKELYKTLKSMTELRMTTYVPYVNRVADHWYRNVYFTPNSLKDYNENYVDRFNNTISNENKNIDKEENIIAVDNDYAMRTGERWTTYELDDDGEYKLYVIDEETGKINEDQQVTKADDGDYVIDEDGVTYRKKKNGEKGEYNVSGSPGDNFRVAKKATDLTTINEQIKKWEEEGNYGAYSKNSTKVNTGWQILDPDNEDLEEMDPQMKKVLTEYKDITVVSTQEYESVEQVEDGIRGETNAKVKKIFLDDYYIYDGTTIRASWIQQAKIKAGSDDPDDLDENLEIAAVYGGEGKSGDALKTTKKQISGKININKEALNAFAILKNMKTLDSEYIYHDFKELVVELNYFDKEDLLENAQQVMMYPIAGSDSTNWPIGGVDKYPTYYGTLLHSKADYEVLINNQIVEEEEGELNLSNRVEDEEEEEEEPIEEEFLRNGEGSDKKYHKDTFFETAEACWEHIVTEKNYAFKADSGQIPATHIHNMNDRIFVSWVLYEYGYDYFEGISKENSFFSISDSLKDNFHLDVNDYSAGEDFGKELKKGDIVSFGRSVGNDGHLVIICNVKKSETGVTEVRAYDCTKAINWTMSNRISGVDITDLVKSNVSGARIIRVDMDPVLYDDVGFESSQPVVAPVSGQVIDYGKVTRENKETGSQDEVGYIKIKILDASDIIFDEHEVPDGEGNSASLFLRDHYSKEDIEKLGYDYFQEEYQNAGIAGDILYMEGFDIDEVLEKGDDEYSSNFSYEMEEGYTVGDYTDDDGNVYHNVIRDNSGSVIRNGGDANADLSRIKKITGTSVGSVSKETGKKKRNNENGVTPNSENAENNFGKLESYILKMATNRYSTKYAVPSMNNKKAEFAIKVGEEAKKQAAYAFDKDGKLYIKEGAIIGYTYEDGSECSKPRDIKLLNKNKKVETIENGGTVGNYIRIILRDLHDEVVENVEDYIERGDDTPDFKITEQFIYWMAFTSEGALVGSKGPEYYKSEDIGDGVGNSGPFGLTKYCDGTAASIGYDEFGQHRDENNVPLSEGEDVFVATLEVEREEVYTYLYDADPLLLNRTSDYMFLALTDLAHAGPVMLQEQVDKYKSQGYLTRKDFQDNWGTATEFKGGLEGRAIRRGILALDEFYAAGNKSGLFEVIWLSKKPWSDFLEKHDNNGQIFGGSAINLVTYVPKEGQFDMTSD